MNGIFIDPNDTVSVDIFVTKDISGSLVADIVEDAFEDEKLFMKDSIEKYSFVFKKPSFKDNVSILGTLSTNDGVNLSFNPLALRLLRFKKLLKSWTLTDNEGKLVPVTESNIENLNPIIADVVSAQLETIVS